MTIDIDRNLVTINDDFVPLTQKEYQIAHLLGMRKGAVLSKDAFISHIYGGIDEPETKIIDVFICKLRRKLRKAGLQDAKIDTIWGQGYMLRNQDMPERAIAC
jgi:two-component system cell cycle response regulator CtrA